MVDNWVRKCPSRCTCSLPPFRLFAKIIRILIYFKDMHVWFTAYFGTTLVSFFFIR
jgi:hypothetical protein